jgi:WD40 repeat protein
VSRATPGADDPNATIEVFPVAIGRFADPRWPDLDVDTQVGRLLELLAEFGATHHRWTGFTGLRDADAVERRMADWAYPAEPRNSVLYWVGHGWTDGFTASLAHALSPAEVRTFGVTPGQLADPVRSRQARSDGRWALVVVDACQSARFVDEMGSQLLTNQLGDRPPSVLLIGVSGDGATTLGRFTDALRRSLHGTFKADTRVRLDALALDLRGQLHDPSIVPIRIHADHVMVRSVPPAASLAGALDTVRYLEDVLTELSADQRQHFISKAQGAEEGEVSWFFEGRSGESARIAGWLQRARGGMLIVTGAAGTGKSALLGNLLVHSLPDLRAALHRRGLVDRLPPASQPPDNAFDVVIHLAGLTVDDAIQRIADAAGLGELPSAADPLSGRANDLDFLAQALSRRAEPLTILTDALDESTDPLDLAGSLLSRIAAEPGVRLIVGTRPSTRDSPDHVATDNDLLEALDPSGRSGGPETVVVDRDPEAVRRYVIRRLTEARDHPVRRQPINDYHPGDETIGAVARALAAGEREFLFARLAVHEMIHTPNLLTAGRSRTLRRLLRGNHRELLDTALRRLAFIDDTFPLLLEALAHARGRGMPIGGDIWGAAAAALDEDADGGPLPRQHLSALLEEDPAYVAVDTDGGQTVYRLAHRTFVEHFLGLDDRPAGERVRRVGRALLETARQAMPAAMPSYLTVHLPGHVASAELWDELGSSPRVLDELDADRVTEEATSSLFGRRALPPAVAGVVTARPELRSAHRSDVAGLRQLAMLTHSDADFVDEGAEHWGVCATTIRRSPVHLRLPGHVGSVNALCVLPDPDPNGRRLIASAGDDGTVRLWEPSTSTPVGEPMTGHDGTVETVCALRGRAGVTLLATGGSDGTIRLWDAATQLPVGTAMAGHVGTVYGICEVRLPSGRRVLASAGDDGSVRLWDPMATGSPGPPLTGHEGTVFGVCAVGLPGETLVASAGQDATVRLWDPVHGVARAVMYGHTGPVWGICTVDGRDGTVLLATTGYDGTLRRWDPLRSTEVGSPISGHRGRVWGVCPVTGRDGAALIASSGDDGTVRLWDADDGSPAGPPMAGHSGAVWRVVALSEPRAGLLATAGLDGTIRVWDPAVSVDGPVPDQPERLNDVAIVPLPDGPALAVTRSNGTLELWDPVTGRLARPPIVVHPGTANAVCMIPSAVPGAAPMVATGGADGTVRLWDPVRGVPSGLPLTGHVGAVHTLCVVAWSDGSHRLASAGDDGAVRQWDLSSRTEAATPLRGHRGTVYGLCVLSRPGGSPPLLVSTGRDGTVRVWDPVTAEQIGPTITGHVGSVYGACALPRDGRSALLVTAGQDGTIRLWDPATGRAVRKPMTVGTGSVFDVCTVDIDGIVHIVATCDDGTVRSWVATTGAPGLGPLRGHVGRVRALCLVPGLIPGRVLATTGVDGSVRLHDLARGAPLGVPMGGHPDSTDVVAALPAVTGSSALIATAAGRASWWDPARGTLAPVGDGVSCALTIAVAGGPPAVVLGRFDGSLQILDAAGRAPVSAPVPTGLGAIVCICALDGGDLAVGGRHGSVLRYDPARRRPVGEPWDAHAGAVRSLGIVEGQPEMLVSGGDDGTVKVWDLTTTASNTPTPAAVANGHAGTVWSVAAAPPAAGAPALVASAGADNTVRIWNATTADAWRPGLTGHDDQVRVVRFIALDGARQVLLSGGHDGTLRLWDPGSGAELRRISIGVAVNTLELLARSPRSRGDNAVRLIAGTRDGAILIDLGPSSLR